jgi:hypothetical protein
VPEPISALVGARRPGPVVSFLQENGEVEGTVRIVTLGGAPIRGFGAGDIPPIFQQDAKVAGRRGMAGCVGPPIRCFGFGQVLAPLQLQAQPELALGERAAVIRRPVCAECDPAYAL